MTDGVALPGLALPVTEGAEQTIRPGASHHVARLPKVDRVRLIADVSQRTNDAPVFDLPKHLPGELKVIPLLIDGPAPASRDEDSVVGRVDEVLCRVAAGVRLEAYVRHSLERHLVKG